MRGIGANQMFNLHLKENFISDTPSYALGLYRKAPDVFAPLLMLDTSPRNWLELKVFVLQQVGIFRWFYPQKVFKLIYLSISGNTLGIAK